MAAVVIWIGIFFGFQLVLCLKVKNRLLRLIPIYAIGLLGLLMIWYIADPWGSYGNWNGTGAFFAGIAAAIALASDALGWVVYKLITRNKLS